MVNEKVVLDTIKRMRGSGVDEETIKSTLADVGLKPDEIDTYLKKEAAGTAEPEAAEPAEPSAQEIKEEMAAQAEAQELRDTTTHAALAEHGEKLAEVAEKVDGVEKKVAELPEKATPSAMLEKRVAQIEADLKETKALAGALKTILEKVLETDRQVLTKLGGKK